jgi:hypothetical protein
MPAMLPRDFGGSCSEACFETHQWNRQFLAAESTVLLFEVASSSAGSMQRRDCPNLSTHVFLIKRRPSHRINLMVHADEASILHGTCCGLGEQGWHFNISLFQSQQLNDP